MPQMPSPVLSLLIISSFFAAAQLGRATDHIVGARLGWNPNINYSNWANNQTFYVNDFISFRYQKHTYNVFEVNETGYDNCTTEGAAGNWSSGKDFILLDEAKRYYFICGTGFCYSGMKVSVVVHPLPSPPSFTTPHVADSKTPGTGGADVLRGGFAGVLAVVFAVSVALIGL